MSGKKSAGAVAGAGANKWVHGHGQKADCLWGVALHPQSRRPVTAAAQPATGPDHSHPGLAPTSIFSFSFLKSVCPQRNLRYRLTAGIGVGSQVSLHRHQDGGGDVCARPAGRQKQGRPPVGEQRVYRSGSHCRVRNISAGCVTSQACWRKRVGTARQARSSLVHACKCLRHAVRQAIASNLQ